MGALVRVRRSAKPGVLKRGIRDPPAGLSVAHFWDTALALTAPSKLPNRSRDRCWRVATGRGTAMRLSTRSSFLQNAFGG
jgi:hypothetical protein